MKYIHRVLDVLAYLVVAIPSWVLLFLPCFFLCIIIHILSPIYFYVKNGKEMSWHDSTVVNRLTANMMNCIAVTGPIFIVKVTSPSFRKKEEE